MWWEEELADARGGSRDVAAVSSEFLLPFLCTDGSRAEQFWDESKCQWCWIRGYWKGGVIPEKRYTPRANLCKMRPSACVQT